MKFSLALLTSVSIVVGLAGAAPVVVDRGAALAPKQPKQVANNASTTARYHRSCTAQPAVCDNHKTKDEPSVANATDVDAPDTEEAVRKEQHAQDSLLPRAGFDGVISKFGEELTRSANDGSHEAAQSSFWFDETPHRSAASRLSSTPLTHSNARFLSPHPASQAAELTAAVAVSSLQKAVEHEYQKYRHKRKIPLEYEDEVERLRRLHLTQRAAQRKRQKLEAMTAEEHLTYNRVDKAKTKAFRSGKITVDEAALLQSLPGDQLKVLQKRYPSLIISGRSRFVKPGPAIQAIHQSKSPRAELLSTVSNTGRSAQPLHEAVSRSQRPLPHEAKATDSPSTRLSQQEISLQRSQASISSSPAEAAVQQDTITHEVSLNSSISSPQSMATHSHSSTGSRYATPSPDYEAMFDAVEDEHMFDGFEVFHKAHSGIPATTTSRSPSSVNQPHSAATSSSSQHGAVHPAVAPAHEASPDTPPSHDYYQWMEHQSLF